MMGRNIREYGKKYGIYLIIALISIQIYDAYSSELYSRIQSLYIEEFLIDGKGMMEDKAMAYLSTLMLPCYLFIMLAPACRSLADKFGRKRMLMVSVMGILIGGGICAFSPSIYIFLIGNMILNFSNSLDIHKFYIIEDIPQKHQGKMRGVTGGIAALAAISVPLLRSVFIDENNQGWRNLYGVIIVLGIIMLVLVCFVSETSEYKLKKEAQPRFTKKKCRNLKDWIKQLIEDYKGIWIGKISYLSVLFLYGIATAGITFYNEPMLSFSGFSESAMEKILMVQPIVCCIVLVLGGRIADRYGWKTIIIGMIVLAIVGCLGFVGLRDHMDCWLALGICYGIMLGGYWSAYHLLELSLIRDVMLHRRGESSAVITYINGIGNAIGIGMFTILLQFLPLPVIKVIMVIPILIIVVCLMHRMDINEV